MFAAWKSAVARLLLAASLILSGLPAAQAQQTPGEAKPQEAKPPEATSQQEPGKDTATKQPDAGKAAAQKPPDGTKGVATKEAAKPTARFDIDEYRIEGADLLPQIDVEEAVYPFLGPKRTADDVEKARAALEKKYGSKGYQTVTVSVPQQNVQGGVVVLKVTEVKVGRLRVKNSRYFDLDKIKASAPSVAEGKVPDLNAVTKDIVALNQWPDRKVTPTLRAGIAPGTVDVDLTVEDKIPVHGSVELNNRQSPNTTPLRTVATLRYDNLWQRGDSISATYQVAPQRSSDAEVFSASYLARTNIDWLNVLVYGVDSKSDVASIGGQSVVGPGQIIGTRAVMTLPGRDGFFHSISIGADYKRFAQVVSQGAVLSFSTPVTYVPIVNSYSATWQRESGLTQLNAGLTFGLRGPGSEPFDFDQKRFKANQNFIYLRGDVSDTEDFKSGVQLYVKGQGQLADQPLVSSEEFSLGGIDTVRGYLETEALGDNAVVGSIELRSPDFPQWLATVTKSPSGDTQKVPFFNEFRLFIFGDVGRVKTIEPLVQQQAIFDLASYGIGTRFKMFDHINGMAVFAMPVISQAFTSANQPRVLFKISGDF